MIGLVVGIKESASAQCSGQFSITYPNGTTEPYNNGSTSATYTYCPDGSGQATFVVTEGNNRNGGAVEVLNSAGTIIKTRRTPQNDTIRLVLPVGSSGSSFTFRHSISCNNNKPVDIPFTLNPSLSLSAAVNGAAVTNTICPGTPVTLTASGATAGATYTFRDITGITLGVNTTGVLEVVPTTSTSYTVSTSIATCGTNAVTQIIRISTSLSLTSNDADNVFTPGQQVVLTASGSSDGIYTWEQTIGNVTTPLAGTGATRTVTPAATTVYKVTTANGASCGPASLTLRPQGVLPVSLMGFSAAWTGQGARLKWTTASELNNALFIVERSFDGFTFSPVARLEGKGTTATRTDYSYTDTELRSPNVTIVYYRLVQQDVNGASTYAAVEVLHGSLDARVHVVAHPNPFTNQLRVQLSTKAAGPATLTLLDGLGRPVRQQQMQLKTGAQEIFLSDVVGLPRGLYFLRVRNAAGDQIVRLSHQ